MKPVLIVACCLSLSRPLVAVADDWPMWRQNSRRSGVSETTLPVNLELQWVRELPPITPAFQSSRLQFDAGYEPIVANGRLLIASSLTDSVTCYDAMTGRENWTFFTNGPVRFAPCVWSDSVCFGSDDGHLYCVSLATGNLRWKIRAVPSQRRVLGNRRLISMWPIRGGPVVDDKGRLYFAAGVWPFEGVFVYAVDVESGNVIWRNDRLGFLFGTQPHNTQAMGGLAPQGYLVLNGEELIVPCSTAYPARLNRNTGQLIEFELPSPGRFPGGWFAAIDPATAKAIRRGQLTFDDVVNRQQHEDKIHKGHGTPGVSRIIVAADRQLKFDDGFEGVEGDVHSMSVADDRLFVSTRIGRIYCFGEAAIEGRTKVNHWAKTADEQLSAITPSTRRVKSIMANVATRYGLAFVVGLDEGSVVRSLLEQSDYHVVAIDGDAERVRRLRTQLVSAGLYGTRAAVIHGETESVQLPPYLATVLTTETDEVAAKHWKPLLQTLRPFGGVAALGFTQHTIEAGQVLEQTPGTFSAVTTGETLMIKRTGGLPGATDYTGGWSASPDSLVRFPLGVLWFDDTLGHFKRSPQPRFVNGGVMISQPKNWHIGLKPGNNTIDYPLMPHVLSDIYTGRVFAASEQLSIRATLTTANPAVREPSQYRPPHQKNAWKPEQPLSGTRTNPLTGESEPRAFPKTYGCDGGVDYGKIYTMRSGTPAFYDKTLESGTVFLSGPRSGCTNSIIPSGGLLNVPYYYEGCTCSYPLPTAFALMAMPESHEQWSCWGDSESKPGSIQRVGLNFGAPGDRMTRDGTLWLDYPPIGGPSPTVNITQVPENQARENQAPAAPTFRYFHSVWMKGGAGHPWVTASMVEGLEQLTLHNLKPGRYAVTLLFAEPDGSKANARLQRVSLQDRVVLSAFDVLDRAGGTMRGVVQQFEDVEVKQSLKLKLQAVKGTTLISGMEIRRTGE